MSMSHAAALWLCGDVSAERAVPLIAEHCPVLREQSLTLLFFKRGPKPAATFIWVPLEDVEELHEEFDLLDSAAEALAKAAGCTCYAMAGFTGAADFLAVSSFDAKGKRRWSQSTSPDGQEPYDKLLEELRLPPREVFRFGVNPCLEPSGATWSEPHLFELEEEEAEEAEESEDSREDSLDDDDLDDDDDLLDRLGGSSEAEALSEEDAETWRTVYELADVRAPSGRGAQSNELDETVEGALQEALESHMKTALRREAEQLIRDAPLEIRCRALAPERSKAAAEQRSLEIKLATSRERVERVLAIELPRPGAPLTMDALREQARPLIRRIAVAHAARRR